MASGEDDGGVSLDIDRVHTLLHADHEKVQKRTFTNWINAQLAKRRPPSFVSDLFSDLRDGSRLLDLLEVITGHPLIKLVNINIPEIINGQPSIILGLIWTIILHCHIEEQTSTLSFRAHRFSFDSLAGLDSGTDNPAPLTQITVPPDQISPLHNYSRVPAKSRLLMWARDQCQRVGCSVSVKDFRSSWRSGEVFLAILCSLRPNLLDLSLVQSRSNKENLEEAFDLAEKELHISRLLEPEDVDVKDPDEKSIMTYVAQLLQYSNDMSSSDDRMQATVADDIAQTEQQAECSVISQSGGRLQEEHCSQQKGPERVDFVEDIADLMDSTDNQVALITEKLNLITRESLDISSLMVTDPKVLPDLMEMCARLHEMREPSEPGTAADRGVSESTSAPSLCQAVHYGIVHVEQLRRRLDQVQSAVLALDRFLSTVREIKAQFPTLLANQDPCRQQKEDVWEQQRHSWQAAVQQSLRTAGEQSDCADSFLKAAGMTLCMDGATVTCQDLVLSLSLQFVRAEKAKKRENNDDGQLDDDFSPPVEAKREEGLQPHAGGVEKKSGNRWYRETEEIQTGVPQRETAEGSLRAEARRRGNAEGEKESRTERKAALIGALREIGGAAEQLELQEPTLPAVQQRTRALTRLQNRLTVLLSEHLQVTSSPSDLSGESPDREVDELCEAVTNALADRMDQCCVVTELLRRFQCVRGEINGALQKAESAISEQSSYVGKDNLQRLHAKLQETKAELKARADVIEEVRNVCRQLQTHFQKIPGCAFIPFEEEADALMDHWLDVSERTDCHLDNLDLGLTLWDSVLQLGAEVESWTDSKLAGFSQSPSFKTEEEIGELQNEILRQEESLDSFRRRVAEIQSLLQRAECPLELQVAEAQTRKKLEQVKEVFSEAEDVYRQMVAVKGQITARMAECYSSLQTIQDFLLGVRGSDAAEVLTEFKEVSYQIEMQEEQAQSLLDDLRVMSSIASPETLQSLAADGTQLQEKVRTTWQLLAQVEEQTQRNIEAPDRVPQGSPEPAPSSQEACCRMEELQHQPAQLHTLYSCPGTAEQSRARLPTRVLQTQIESLQKTLRSMAEHSRELAEETSNTSWSNTCWTELERCSSSLMAELNGVFSHLEECVCTEEHFDQLMTDCHQKLTSLQERILACRGQKESCGGPELQGLLQELTDAEKDVSQLAALRDSINETSTFQVQTSHLQNHQRSLDGYIRGNLEPLKESEDQRVQRAMEEASQVQKDLSVLVQDVGNLCGSREAILDVSLLQQQLSTIQDCVSKVSEEAGFLPDLQETRESATTQQILPGEIHFSVDVTADDLNSVGSIFLPKKQDCAENAGNSDGQVVVQAEPSASSQMGESMEPERTALGLESDLGAKDATGGSPESQEHWSTMQDMLSEIQSLVERSNITNRTPHIDLNGYLDSCPGEPEIRLARTVQKVLACRYQPAQLSVTAMANQLKEAEDYRCSVQDQVAAMSKVSAAAVSDPVALKSTEGQWKAALLDASATVQVKAAQLDQVKQYHRHVKIARAFLEVVAAEKKNCNLQTLGSSALQAEKLNFLQQTMKQKKGMVDTLLQSSSHLSAHLSDSESSGALLAQLGDVHEEWRLLEGSIKRSLWLASNSTSQYSLIMKEAKQLQAKLEALQESNLSLHSSRTIPDCKKALEFICLTADLKLLNQLHLYLQSRSDALGRFSLGQKEKDEIKGILEELGSLLSVTRSKLDSSAGSTCDLLPGKINKQLRDLVTWAKQVDYYITVGTRLALFPQEARLQIAEMKKFQIDVLSRRAKMQTEVEMIKTSTSDLSKETHDQVLSSLKAIEKLYEATADSSGRALIAVKATLQEREELLRKLARIDAWLAERLSERRSHSHAENDSKAAIQKLESELRAHKSTITEIESQLTLLETIADSCKVTAVGLRPGESRYLVNRLSGLWTELDGWLAHEKAASWELEELINEQTSSDEEFSTILSNVKQISADLTQGSVANIGLLKHMLIEYQCQIQDLQHCHEAKRSALLGTIGELQDRCKALSLHAAEQEKYLQHRKQMEESQDIAKRQIQSAKDKTISVDERFRLCQTLLVEFPLMKTQCQDAADQLEAMAQELDPSELSSETERIRCAVESLVSGENSVTEDIKQLEASLLEGLHFCPELSALTKLFQRTRVALKGSEPVDPDIKAIDIALQRYWVIWRSIESGMRVFEALGYEEKMNLTSYRELHLLMDAAMQECRFQMESLSQARESLKDYQWAAQGAMRFLPDAEATFLSAAGEFLDCNEEEMQTAQALGVLGNGFQAHICHLVELVPQQHCLSQPKMEQLHTRILSRLLVGRAVLEAQAHLRLESLQRVQNSVGFPLPTANLKERCAKSQPSHMQCHEDIQQHLSRFESRLSECAAEQVTSHTKCVDQQKRAKLLMEDLHHLAEKIEELRARCPIQGCWVGRDSQLGILWRRWVSLRRGVGLFMARAEQRGEEWMDITASMEQCCTFLASLQAEVPDSCTLSFTQEDPCEITAQAEMHQAGLEQEQQALASLEHRLEHALSLTSCKDPISPGYVGKTLAKIQENVRSLTERNRLVIAAAQAEEKERGRVHEELEEVEQHVVALLPRLAACSYPRQQDLRNDLSSQKDKLKCIKDGVQNRYTQIPTDINRRIQEVELSLQRAEEKIAEKFDPARKLAVRVGELSSGLQRVKVLLEQRSPTVEEAQNVLKRVWDELDAWHSRLMLLENEVQDLAEEQSAQAHLLMDQLTWPQQLYQEAAQMAECRTAFLSKIPACLQEFEDILFSTTCWLEEAQSWLGAPCSYATARSLQNHANSLQLVLDDSERIRATLQDFRLVLAEISDVCDMSAQEERLMHTDHQVHTMQRDLITPLEDILHAAAVVDATEAELKTMEKNVAKIRTILNSMDNCGDSPTEQLHNLQVVLANIQSMQRTLEEMERYKGELDFLKGTEENPVVFCRAGLLLQSLQDLERVTQQQTVLLKTSISKEEETEETSQHVAMVTAPDALGDAQQRDESPGGKFVKDAFVGSNSEEEEDEDDDDGPLSSSSDTLTCSIPEDPEETLHISDVDAEDVAEIMQLSDVKARENLLGRFSSEVEPSLVDVESVTTGLDSMKSGCENVESRLTSQESRSGSEMFNEGLRPESATAGPWMTAAVLTDHSQSAAAVSPDRSAAPKGDTRAHRHQAAAAAEGTRFIPARPTTPFTRALEELIGDEHLSGSNDVSYSRSGLVEEPHQEQESSESLNRMTGDVEKQTEQQRWNHLHRQISDKLTALKKVQEMHPITICSGDEGTKEKASEREVEAARCTSVALQRIQDAVTILQKLQHTTEVSCGPGAEEELYEAVRRVLVCLDGLFGLMLTSGEDDPELRPQQHEVTSRQCVSAELVTAAETLNNVASDVRPVILNKDPDAVSCSTRLQERLLIVRAVLASTHDQLLARLDAARPHQDISSEERCILDPCDLERMNEMFPNVKESLSLECVLARHLRACPEERANRQRASQSLLEGLTRLVDLGEECIAEGRTDHIHNRGQLQAVLCRRQTFLQVLGSQLAFAQLLFQQEPEAVACQESEWAQLDARAKALQQHALEQETASQRRLQEWTCWEDNYGQLCRRLDELEAFISSREPEEEDDGMRVQHRLDACQQALAQLDESRALLGLVLSQERELQTSASPSGGALELRWQRVCQRVEHEILHCRDIQDGRVRFHTNLASVSEWLVGANKQLETWSDLADTSDPKQEVIGSHLIKLLDFSADVKAMSVQRTSLFRDATLMHHLTGADHPAEQSELNQLEANWNQLTSDLSNIQDRLQQRLLSVWPPLELLSDLQLWLKNLESRLNQESEMILKVKDAAQIHEILQRYQELKAAVVTGQHFLDFLCQPDPQAVEVDLQTLCSKRTTFAEELGATTLQLLSLQRELESQIRGAEQMHHVCAVREKRLTRLRRCAVLQEKKLKRLKQLSSQSEARKALLEWETFADGVKEADVALQELKVTHARADSGGERPCDVTFSEQADGVEDAYRGVAQQLDSLRPALQQTVEEWKHFESDLRKISEITTRVCCALQHQGAPLFSLKQAKGRMNLLEQLEETTEEVEEMWVSVGRSSDGVVKMLHGGTAQFLCDQMEAERKRCREAVQELKEEQVKTEELLRLWQEYTRHVEHLRRRWEELQSSSHSPHQDYVKLQDVTEDLQTRLEKVQVASKNLTRHLEPMAANLIQSESILLSRDVLLLNRAIAEKNTPVQEDLKQQKMFHASLDALDTQTEDIKQKLKTSVHDTDSLKQVLLELTDQFSSLVDIGEMSDFVTLNDQDRDRIRTLVRRWIESVAHASDTYRGVQNFEQKCEKLTCILAKLEHESEFVKPRSYSSFKEMLAVHQRHQAEIIVGQQLLQDLLWDAGKSAEKEMGEKKSELVADVASVKERWFTAVALAVRRRTAAEKPPSQWRLYRHGLWLLWKMLKDGTSSLHPAERDSCTLHRLRRCTDNYQCTEDTEGLYSVLFTLTLEAGRQLSESATESQCQSQLQSELRALQEAWDQTGSLLRRRAVTGNAELQETDLPLQHLAAGLRQLATMKSDLSQYVTAGDSTALEQQLEQLHWQWEELCAKVSLRRQEIADRLNAWTIFNDKNKEFCDWLTQMENKVCHRGELSIEEMLEKLKKDCMEEFNLFSENKSHLKQLGEQLLLASDEAKQSQVHGSLQEVNQRWHSLFRRIEARVAKLKTTLITVQQLDKNMSNLRSWLSHIEAELSRPISYSVCHHQEIQRRMAEQQELQRDIDQHTEGIASVLRLCDVLLRDEDVAGGTEADSDSLQETSRSLDQHWKTICSTALNRRLRIEETWRLWCKFLDDYTQFDDWLKTAEVTAANPNSADVLYTVAKEELKTFEGFQRQVHERLTHLEIVNNQYRRLARENRTDRAGQLKSKVYEGNRRWNILQHRVAAIVRRLKYFTSQREEFEGTRESMLVWLTELDLQLTDVEHFSESDIHHKIQQLNSFQKEISLNTERIDGLIVFGEGLIQKSSPQDAALIEDELEELHSYCQEVFSRLVRFHQRLSQPPMVTDEPTLPGATLFLEGSLELIGRPWLGRSLPATPTHLLTSPLERSGRETPVSVDSLPLEWDHTVDVGGSSSHEDEEEDHDDEGTYVSALSVASRSEAGNESPRFYSADDGGNQPLQMQTEDHTDAPPTLASTPLKQSYMHLMSACSGSIEDIRRVSLILDDEEQPEELGLTGLTASDKQSGVIERWELLQAQSRSDHQASPLASQHLTSDLDKITSWLERVIPELNRLQQSDPAASIEEMAAQAKELKDMQKMSTHYKPIMLSINLRAQGAPELQQSLASVNQGWSRACTGLQRWDTSLRKTLMRCQEFHERLHSLLLWLAQAESRRYAVDISCPDTPIRALRQHHNTLTDLKEALQRRQDQQASLQALWSQLQPQDGAEETDETQEKLHVTGSKLKTLLRGVDQDLSSLQQRLANEPLQDVQGESASPDSTQKSEESPKPSSSQRETRDRSPPRSFFYRLLRAAFPLHLLLMLLLLLVCLVPFPDSDSSCTMTNNFAWSFYPMLQYTNGPPPT